MNLVAQAKRFELNAISAETIGLIGEALLPFNQLRCGRPTTERSLRPWDMQPIINLRGRYGYLEKAFEGVALDAPKELSCCVLAEASAHVLKRR
jgi:hypothetical protein